MGMYYGLISWWKNNLSTRQMHQMFARICFPLHSTFNMEACIENMDEFDERAFSMRKSGSIMME